MLQLCLKLESPLCASTGIGRPGIADRDAAFDEFGLPYIPARRLKGLLRDAYRSVWDCGKLAERAGFPSVDDLFGRTGNDQQGLVSIRNARLVEDIPLKVGIRRAIESGAATRDEVMATFSELRRQTAIGRDSGAPLRETLRSTRVISSGNEFVRAAFAAEIDPLDSSAKLGLALAAAALEYMGSGRTRGLGHVRAYVSDSGQDVTLEAVDVLCSGRAASISRNRPSSVLPVAGGTCGQTPDYVLRYTLELLDQALIPGMEGDPNTVSTRETICGSSIHGIFAATFHNLRPNDSDTFQRLFTLGNVAFLDATPAEGGVTRTFAIPASLRQYKASDAFVDLARAAPKPNETLRRLHGWTDVRQLQDGRSDVPRVEVRTALEYHHARADDRRLGRALSDEQARDLYMKREQSGNLFTYETLAGGQTFAGAVLGGREDLTKLIDIVASGDTVRFGRSRSAQYGGRAIFTWIDAMPRKIGVWTSETGAWKEEHPVQDAPGDRVLVTLLSPMLSTNPLGHPAPEFPVDELCSELGLGDDALLEIEAAWARQEWHGGYLSHQALPRQQWPALAAGSVFKFKARRRDAESTPIEIAPEKMREAERRSYGVRIEHGYGRLSIRSATPFPSPSLGQPSPAVPPSPRIDTPIVSQSPAGRLLTELLRRRLRQVAQESALALAAESQTRGIDRVSMHALQRAIAMARERPLRDQKNQGKEFCNALKRLRDTAERQLRRCIVFEDGVPMQLMDFLTVLAENPSKRYAVLAKDAYDLPGWRDLFSKNPLEDAPEGYQQNIVRDFLLRYLQSLVWRKREREETR